MDRKIQEVPEGYILRKFRCLQFQIWSCGRLVGRADPRKIGDFASARLFVETARITSLADIQWSVNKNFRKANPVPLAGISRAETIFAEGRSQLCSSSDCAFANRSPRAFSSHKNAKFFRHYEGAIRRSWRHYLGNPPSSIGRSSIC